MSQQTEQLWKELLEAELVQGTPPETDELESPWYVKALLAFSGWLAALFLLGFIGAGFMFIFNNSAAAFLIGGVMIGGAFTILRMPRNEFVEHLALAVSMAGQALVIFAIYDVSKSSGGLMWASVALLQVALAWVMPNYVHRVFSAFIAAVAFSMSLLSIGAPYIFSGVVLFLAAWLWLNEFHYPQHMRKMRAIGYGLVLALIPLKGTALFGHGAMAWRSAHNQTEMWIQPWMSEVFAGVVTLYVVLQLLHRRGHTNFDHLTIVALLGTVLLTAVSVEARGITVGIVIMLLGFAGSNRILLGLGIVSLLFYISSYYYLLDVTLLNKALTLLIVGLVLLATRWLMMRFMPKEKELKHVQ